MVGFFLCTGIVRGILCVSREVFKFQFNFSTSPCMKKVSMRTVSVSGAIVFLCAALVVVVGSYARYETNGTAQKIASSLRFPAFIVWNPFFVFTTTELRGDMQSVRKFYEGQDFSSVGMRVDFTTEDGKKRLLSRERGILNKAIEDRIIEQIVNDAGARVTDEEVDQNVDRRLHEFGVETGKIEESLNRLYGWTIEDFKEKVVRTELYKEKANKIFEERTEKGRDEEARKKIDEAKRRLDAGVSFSDVAKDFSEGSTAKQEGDLGWIELSGAEPNLADAIKKMKVGDRSNVIETSLGYHIVEVRGMRDDAGTKLYHVYQIIARKEVFADWVNDRIKKSSVIVFLPDYQWNGETGYVEFTNPVMTEFETKSFNPKTLSLPSESAEKK